jgi:hypothetical protein
MATFPTLGQRKIARDPRGISSYDVSVEGRAIEGLGNTMLKAGKDLMQRQQQESDAAAVLDARRQLDDWERATLYDPQNGAVAKLGRDSFDLPTTIPKSFDEFAGKLGEGLTSQRQRVVFGEIVASRRDQALTFVDRHTFQQRQAFEEGQHAASIDSMLGRAAMLVDAGDLPTAQAELKQAQTVKVGFLKSRGRSEEEIAIEVRNLSSRAAVTTVNVLLEKNKPAEADAYLKANAGTMKVEDMLRAQGAVGKALEAVQSEKVVDDVFRRSMAPAVQATDMGRLTNLVMGAESGGQRYGADGKLLTSPKGAKGEMQVLDSTNKDPGYGVKPAKDDSPDERARVGRDYLEAMLREYGGDVPKALAAYNAGPGAVNEAIMRANARQGGDWMTFMPAETKAYVAKISKQFASGEGVPGMPTLQSLHDEVRARIPAENPQARKQALAAMTTRYEVAVKANKQAEDENTARAYQWLAQNGGRFNQMPANLRAHVPAKEFDNLLNYGQRIAKGEDITNPVVFQKMATDDAWLKGLTDAQFYLHTRQLSQSDAQQMALRRGKLLNKLDAAGKGPSDLDTTAVNAILNNRLQQIEIDPSPKDASAGAQRVGAIRKFVWDSVLQAQQAAGKKFNDAEMTTVIDKLFAQNVKFQTSFLGINTGTSSSRLLGMKPDDIPGDVRARLKKDFAAQGVSEPTDADLLGAYFKLKTARR